MNYWVWASPNFQSPNFGTEILKPFQSHENPNFKAYVNGSLYSVLSIQEFKDYAKEMGLEALLTSFMKEDEKDTENYGVSKNNFFIKSCGNS